jgi:hypothetical protein
VKLIHQDPEFEDLVRIVARDTALSNALVEKDYWVTHALWAVQRTRLDVWLKGGTSLSKGFGLIERFSEDLDLRIEPGAEPGVPTITSWKSVNRGPVARRRAFYESLERIISIPGVPLELDPDSLDRHARGASYRARYPGRFIEELHPAMRPFVLLEVGTARVTPFVARTIVSFVHDWLERHGRIAEYEDNRPRDTRCVHPLVTLVEKIDAVVRRYPREGDPASFIRHYEDAARIIQAKDRVPDLDVDFSVLVRDLIEQKQIRAMPSADDPAFALTNPDRRAALQEAHAAIAPMFWGDRLSLKATCEIIRDWLGSL